MRISTGDWVATYLNIKSNLCHLSAGNGELLQKAANAEFEVLVTMDSNMVHQQNIDRYAIAVIALRAPSNRLGDTRPLMPALLAVLPQVKPGTVTFLPETA